MSFMSFTIYQGRGIKRVSMIDNVRGTGEHVAKSTLKFPDLSSQASSVGLLKSVSKTHFEKPTGVCASTNPATTWFCEPCNTRITNDSTCVQQHRISTKHKKNVESWGSKEYQAFICHICSESFENDPNLLRKHWRLKHSIHASDLTDCSASSTKKRSRTLQLVDESAGPPKVNKTFHHCDCCGTDMENNPTTVNAHNASFSHTSMKMLRRDGDSRPDGPALATAAAAANADKRWVTVTKRNGQIVNKLVQKKKVVYTPVP